MKYTLQEHQAKKLLSNCELDESTGIMGKIKPETATLLSESAKGKNNRKLIVQMEAIHVGRTANYTYYTEQGLREGLSSWTHPYSKPVLTHHNSETGEPIGRILKAEFAESTISGRKGLIFTCEITESTAIEKVLDGRYQTVSIGATTDKVTCNICGTDRAKEWCEHWRGEAYEGTTCHYTVGTTFGREVSYVNVPADENAGNFSISIEDETGSSSSKESASMEIYQIAEGLMQNIRLPEVNLYESASEDVRQLVDGLLQTKEGSVPSVKFKLNESGQVLDETGAVIAESIEKMHDSLTEALAEVTTGKLKLQEAQAALATITIEKTKVDSQLAESQAEVDRLVSENSDLASKAHLALVEKVIDMKLALRKSDVVGVSREEAIENHTKRTEESLTDAANDLQEEMKSTLSVRGVVPNPGKVEEDPQLGESNKDEEKVSIEEAVGMFKGMFGKKR